MSTLWPELEKMNELLKVERNVARDLKKVEKAVETLFAHHQKMKAPRIAARMGSINSDIFSNAPIRQTDLLSTLPNELKIVVWSYLVHQPDRIALALTCKLNAQFHDAVKDRYAKIAIKVPQKEHRLAVLIRLSRWMPNGYRLCFECVQFCNKGPADNWGGDSNLERDRSVKHGRVVKNAMTGGPRCPRCKYRCSVEQLDRKEVVRSYKRILSQRVGPLYNY